MHNGYIFCIFTVFNNCYIYITVCYHDIVNYSTFECHIVYVTILLSDLEPPYRSLQYILCKQQPSTEFVFPLNINTRMFIVVYIDLITIIGYLVIFLH